MSGIMFSLPTVKYIVHMANGGRKLAHGLVYLPDDGPGIRRVRSGKGFKYVDTRGRALRKPAVLKRIRSLVIPPAWESVWISPVPNGHIQCTGRDAKGRKQYRYHPRWNEKRNATKFDRMTAFGKALPKLRRTVSRHLRLSGMPREKVIATVVRLLEQTHIRVGNDEYAKTNHSYGLTTMRNNHVKVRGANVKFTFKGKSGIRHAIDVSSPPLAKIVRRCQELPGQQLFEYLEDGEVKRISSTDVNEYLHEVMGEEFTAKDFRTWNGSVLAAVGLCDNVDEKKSVRRKKQLVDLVREVAKCLGNTPATCKKFYIHPNVLALFEASSRPGFVRDGSAQARSALSANERLLLRFLRSGTARGS